VVENVFGHLLPRDLGPREVAALGELANGLVEEAQLFPPGCQSARYSRLLRRLVALTKRNKIGLGKTKDGMGRDGRPGQREGWE
jgi:hypothetical protein